MRPPIPDQWGTPLDSDGLRAWRKARRVSQQQLADILRITKQTVWTWENSLAAPSPFLHLALESVDRRLNFSARPGDPLPGRPRARPNNSPIRGLDAARAALAEQLD